MTYRSSISCKDPSISVNARLSSLATSILPSAITFAYILKKKEKKKEKLKI